MSIYQNTGVIFLAAGKSSRFMKTSNVPKALYPVAQMTWLEYSMISFDSLDQVIITGAHQDLFQQTPNIGLIVDDQYVGRIHASSSLWACVHPVHKPIVRRCTR